MATTASRSSKVRGDAKKTEVKTQEGYMFAPCLFHRVDFPNQTLQEYFYWLMLQNIQLNIKLYYKKKNRAT